METYANVDMEDYWNEYKTLKALRTEHRGSNSEEDCRSHEDDVDSDDPFLEAVLSERFKEDRELSETELANSRLYNTLTPRQKEQLIKRTQQRNLTLRQKRLKARGGQKPDLWSIFSTTDNSSTGTRSRSATPDSLDSISPPRTPPDPSPKNWVEPHLSRSRASLDSGHHSLITSPSNSFSPISPPSTSPHHLEIHLVVTPPSRNNDAVGHKRDNRKDSAPEDTDNDKYYYETEEELRDKERMIYRAPSLDLLSKNYANNYPQPTPKEVSVRRQRSYAKDITKDVKYYYSNKGLYEFNPRLYYEPEVPDVQGIRYQQIGSLHMKNVKNRDHREYSEEIIAPEDYLSKSPEDVHRSHSVKHYPRDPFDHVSDNEIHSSNGHDSVVKAELENFENGIRNSTSTDLGFKVHRSDKDGVLPELVIEVGRSGQTKVDWLHQNDVAALTSLALLELDILFSENNINHSWRKRNKKRKTKEAEHGVFGVSLETLQEKDKTFQLDPFTESNVPQILHKLMKHLELRGLKDEGILRIPGHRAKTEELRRNLDENFYSSPHLADEALRKASPNELAALIKLFLRELPHPLLTHFYASAFYKTHRIPNLGERVLALTMLILLLSPTYRDTLKVILDLCARVVANERENKMGLYNVAMIIAPNIFLPSLQPKLRLQIREDKEQQLNAEMEYARVTTQLVQVLIKYRAVLWTVPNRLIAQVRRQYEASLKPSSSKPIHRLLSKRNKDLIHRPIANEVEYQNGVLRISAPQFNKINHPVKLDWKMTARDILSRFIEEQTHLVENPHRVVGRREQQQQQSIRISASQNSFSALPQKPLLLPPVAMTTCLLRGSLRHALENHALHERGGNITERRIDPCAYLIAIYQDNPNGEFVVKCHHPGGRMETK